MTSLFEAKPFIVAEVGSNWSSFEHAKDSISLAKNCGANAVKFQLFTDAALYGPGVRDTTYGASGHHYLPTEWLPKLKEKADACGIELMCTAFSPELVEAVDPFVSVHKVASSDLSYPQLLKAVAKTGKPIILSAGASNLGDITLALQTLKLTPGCSAIVVLYCVAAYPALHADLRIMQELAKMCGHVGFSDHTPGTYMAIEAARKGAVVIEKHFTAFPELDTPDRGHSLTADEFKIMVDHIRGKREPVIGPTPEELPMVLRHNRRLIAIQDVDVGTKLEYGKNFGAYRSLEDDTRGLSPFAWEHVNGKKAKNLIPRGKGIGPGDFA